MVRYFRSLLRNAIVEPIGHTASGGTDERPQKGEMPLDRAVPSEKRSSSPSSVNDSDEPQPLIRQEGEPGVFPLEAVGGTMAAGIRGLMEHARVPRAMAGNSVLTAMASVVQAHRKTKNPASGVERPCSIFASTVADVSGRKSTTDSIAMRPIREFEHRALAAYCGELAEIRQQEHAEADPAVLRVPEILIEEATYEGLLKKLAGGLGYAFLNNDDAVTQLCGAGMNDENRMKMGGGLSRLWEGASVRRSLAGPNGGSVSHKAISVHWQIQPIAAAILLGSKDLGGQGLLSRFLCAWPESLVGTRLLDPVDPGPSLEAQTDLQQFHNHLETLLSVPVEYHQTTKNDLTPRLLPLSQSAIRAWTTYFNEVEADMRGKYASIEGFAGKLGEHVLRLAVVLRASDDLEAHELTADDVDCAVALARFYTHEAQRLMGFGMIDDDLRDAQKLLAWMHNSWKGGDFVSTPDTYQRGPQHVRTSARAKQLCRILADHGWLRPTGRSREILGRRRQDVWRIVR